MTEQHPDLARTTLSVLYIGGLIAGSLWILSPFRAAFIWAVMIVVACTLLDDWVAARAAIDSVVPESTTAT